MANIKSQEKRIRQNEKRRQKNSQVKSSVRTSIKNLINTLEGKKGTESANAQDLYKKFVKIIDNAVGKGIVHKNTAARKKSRLAKRINSIAQ